MGRLATTSTLMVDHLLRTFPSPERYVMPTIDRKDQRPKAQDTVASWSKELPTIVVRSIVQDKNLLVLDTECFRLNRGKE